MSDAVFTGLLLFLSELAVSSLFRTITFRTLPGYTLAQSYVVFWVLWVGFFFLSLLFTHSGKRNWSTGVAMAGFCNTLYLFASMADLYRAQILLICAVIGISIGIYTIASAVCNRAVCRRKPLHFLSHLLHRCWHITGFCLAGILLFFCLYTMGDGPLVQPSVAAKKPGYHSDAVSENMDTVLLLQEDLWNALSPRERMDVLQTVANIEACHLGLPHELNVVADEIGEDLLGYYSDDTHSITLNALYLPQYPSYAMLHAVAHEAYHAYEHRLVDLFDGLTAQEQELMLLNRARTYKEEFEDYTSASEDPFLYYYQLVELDAQSYASDVVDEYYDILQDYLSDSSNS